MENNSCKKTNPDFKNLLAQYTNFYDVSLYSFLKINSLISSKLGNNPDTLKENYDYFFSTLSHFVDTLFNYLPQVEYPIDKLKLENDSFFNYYALIRTYVNSFITTKKLTNPSDYLKAERRIINNAKENNSFIKRIDEIHEADILVKNFLTDLFLLPENYDIYSIETLKIINDYLEKNITTNDTEIKRICRPLKVIYQYVFSRIILNSPNNLEKINSIFTIKSLDDLDKIKDDNELFLIFSVFGDINEVASFIVNGKLNLISITTLLNTKKEFETKYQIKIKYSDFITLAKSAFFKKYVNNTGDLNININSNYGDFLNFIIHFKDIFLKVGTIENPLLLEYVFTLNNDELVIAKNILNDYSGIKITQEILIFLIKNTIITKNMVESKVIKIAIKYFDLGIAKEDILSLGLDILDKIDKSPQNKKTLIENCLKDRQYFENERKNNIINIIVNDLEYLGENCEGKEELRELLDNSANTSIEIFEAKKLSIYLRYNIESIVKRNKKIFPKNENLVEKLRLLGLLESLLNDYVSKNDALQYIFTNFSLDKVIIISNLLSNIELSNNMSLNNFKSLIETLLIKSIYHDDIIKSKNKIKLKDLEKFFDYDKLKARLISDLKNIFGDELFEILSYELGIKYGRLPVEKIHLIISVSKKITSELYEDLILNIGDFDEEKLRKLESIISTFKRLNIKIDNFNTYILALNNINNFELINSFLSNATITRLSEDYSFKELILKFIESGDITELNSYINSLSIKTINVKGKTDVDKKIEDIYLNGTLDDKIKLVQNLEIVLGMLYENMHPSKTTSTKNTRFKQGSGGYTEIIWKYILKKLLKRSEESYDEYLYRILNLNISNVTGIQNMSEINEYHGFKCLYLTLNSSNGETYCLFDFLNIVQKSINHISGDVYINLSELSLYFSEEIEKVIKVLKRSLDII